MSLANKAEWHFYLTFLINRLTIWCGFFTHHCFPIARACLHFRKKRKVTLLSLITGTTNWKRITNISNETAKNLCGTLTNIIKLKTHSINSLQMDSCNMGYAFCQSISSFQPSGNPMSRSWFKGQLSIRLISWVLKLDPGLIRFKIYCMQLSEAYSLLVWICVSLRKVSEVSAGSLGSTINRRFQILPWWAQIFSQVFIAKVKTTIFQYLDLGAKGKGLFGVFHSQPPSRAMV